jgi:hypothetical protein
MYNEVWFVEKPASHPPPFDFKTSQHIIPPFACGPFPSVAELDADSISASTSAATIISNDSDCQNPDPFAICSFPTAVQPTSGPELVQSIRASKDRMFFIQYLPEGTLRPRWYLVSVNSVIDEHPDPADCRNTGTFQVDFFCRHPDDKSKSDAYARWWREWHRYSTDPIDGTVLFGDQVLFRPGHTPPPDKYIAWADFVPLLDPTVALVGPFDLVPFAPDTTTNRPSARQWVPLPIWHTLCSLCASKGILPPSISSQPILRSRWTKTKKRKRVGRS